jgi:type IV pilus assembly protein PilC
MPIFTCKLGSADGRIFEKELEAANPEMLRQSLEDQGFFVFGVKKRPFQFLWDKGIARSRVGNKELITLNQELLVLLKAGLPIIQALDTILERIDSGRLADVLKDVREDIKGGRSLSEALMKFPRAFPQLYVASIMAGERTGDLPLTIKRFNLYLKKSEVMKKKLIGALVYPGILVTVAAVAITVLLVYVVPTFSQVYSDAGSQLPVPTQLLINFTGFLRRFFLVFVGLTIGAVALFRSWAITEKGRYIIDSYKLKLPLVGEMWRKYSLTSFTRTLATVIGSGIPIVESLKMVVGTLNNVILERKLLTAVTRVEEGTRLSVALESEHFMPPLAIRMLSVGETIGSLEEMLVEISEYFEEELEERLGVLATAIEPAIMIVMGLVIGVIIITMYLPVFKIAGTVG